jgi:hypothetical protein
MRPDPPVCCPSCGRALRTRGLLGLRKRALLAHLRACHGPLRRAEVRAMHALTAPAFDSLTRPPA